MPSSALQQLLEGLLGTEARLRAGRGASFRLGQAPTPESQDAFVSRPWTFADVHQVNTSFEAKSQASGTVPGKETEVDPSKLESGLPDDDERTECNLSSLKLGNQTGQWSKERDDIKWAYDNALKGQEVQIWWPGRTDRGECNNLHDEDRGCWYRAKLLNDTHCTDGDRCIHFAAHDGEPTNTFTCPTWIRDPDGIGCKLPKFEWQACPMRFKLKRVDTGLPQEFKQALSTPCSAAVEKPPPPVPEHQFPERDANGEVKQTPGAPADEAAGEPKKVPPPDDGAGKDPGKEPENAEPPVGHCSGATNDGEEPRMIMDIKKNTWYRCNNMMRCEPWDIRKIIDEENAQCGKKKCGPEQQCFVHRVSALQSTYQCVKDEEVILVPDGDDVAKLGMPFPVIAVSPPTKVLNRRRCLKTRPFL
mmetsp:Transcript_11139/g.26786  ORF Transcript_11139/g.26786 Transcript_11139/m.26786 type:complete len:418 (+) Transcript_11139:27-1280(+)